MELFYHICYPNVFACFGHHKYQAYGWCGFADAIPCTMGFNYIRAHCNYYNGFHDVLCGSQLIKTLVETRVHKQIAFITKCHEPICNQNYLAIVSSCQRQKKICVTASNHQLSGLFFSLHVYTRGIHKVSSDREYISNNSYIRQPKCYFDSKQENCIIYLLLIRTLI